MSKHYWRITHTADTTETGLPMRVDYVETSWESFPAHDGHQSSILRDWCRDVYGAETAYVQGVAPVENWAIHECTKEEWGKANPIRWGGYQTETKRLRLAMGKGGVLHQEETDGKPTPEETLQTKLETAEKWIRDAPHRRGCRSQLFSMHNERTGEYEYPNADKCDCGKDAFLKEVESDE